MLTETIFDIYVRFCVEWVHFQIYSPIICQKVGIWSAEKYWEKKKSGKSLRRERVNTLITCCLMAQVICITSADFCRVRAGRGLLHNKNSSSIRGIEPGSQRCEFWVLATGTLICAEQWIKIIFNIILGKSINLSMHLDIL